jgi:signal transduction histidine kinase
LDIKSKSRKKGSFLSWLCFFLGVSILLTAVGGALFYTVTDLDGTRRTVKSLAENDVQKTREFQGYVSNLTFSALSYLSENTDEFSSQYPGLRGDAANLIVYGKNSKGNRVVSNINDDGKNRKLAEGLAPEGYNYLLSFDGENLKITRDGTVVYDTVDQIDRDGYEAFLEPLADRDSAIWQNYPRLDKCRLFIAVAENPTALDASAGGLSGVVAEVEQKRLAFYAGICAAALGVILLVVSIALRKRKAEFEKSVARLTGRLWVETKGIATVIFVIFFFFYTAASRGTIGFFILLYLLFWYLMLIVNDIRFNPQFYRHSFFGAARRVYRDYLNQKPFQKRFLARFWQFAAMEVLLFILLLLFAFRAPPAACFPAAAMIALLYFYGRAVKETVSDFGLLLDRIASLKAGTGGLPLRFARESDLAAAAADLDSIESGISRAVEARVKSERMKVDLITNVSHDIKTPLTSIINYIDLLQREENLPGEVRDYVDILARKADRLKRMVQDIFDISKASSGNMELRMEELDLNKLLQQTLADMQENIDASGLTVKTLLPEGPVFIYADGNRLYRVFQNLIKNALQYSLEGSRVFISLQREDGKALAQVKNASKYALDNAPDITERFVRGDESRTTEGSGLGLSIAKSFTEACGGTFEIRVDADLFSASVTLPLYVPDTREETEGNGETLEEPGGSGGTSGSEILEPDGSSPEETGEERKDDVPPESPGGPD